MSLTKSPWIFPPLQLICGAWFKSGTHWHHSNDSLLPDNEPEIILK